MQKLFSLSKIIFSSFNSFFMCVWKAETHFTLTSMSVCVCVYVCFRVRTQLIDTNALC